MNQNTNSVPASSTNLHSNSVDQLLHTAPVEPWHEPVDGALLLDELAAVIRRFVVLPKCAPETLALWIVHTYAFELRDVSTYLGLESPEKRCGKTTLLAVLSELVNRPVVAANISPPALFRTIEDARPTLLIDEADTFLQANDERRGILNAGYSRKTAYVVRVGNQTKAGIAKTSSSTSLGAPNHSEGGSSSSSPPKPRPPNSRPSASLRCLFTHESHYRRPQSARNPATQIRPIHLSNPHPARPVLLLVPKGHGRHWEPPRDSVRPLHHHPYAT